MREIEPPKIPFVDLGYIDSDGITTYAASWDGATTPTDDLPPSPVRTLITTGTTTFVFPYADTGSIVETWIRNGRPRRDNAAHPVIDGEVIDHPMAGPRPAITAGRDREQADRPEPR